MTTPDDITRRRAMVTTGAQATPLPPPVRHGFYRLEDGSSVMLGEGKWYAATPPPESWILRDSQGTPFRYDTPEEAAIALAERRNCTPAEDD